MEMTEIRAKLKQTIKDCKKYNYFLYHKEFEIDDIPTIVELMYSVSGLLHAFPENGNYRESLSNTGYLCTYKDCPVPEGLIPKYKDERTGNEYHVNASFNAYGLFIRDFTHDLNASLYTFKEFYNRYKNDAYSYPKEFVYEYALYLQPFLCTVLNCAEHLLNGDEYEGEPLYYSRQNRKDGIYKTYYLNYQCIKWEDKNIYVYNFPVLNKNQITQKFVWKTRNTFELVRE